MTNMFDYLAWRGDLHFCQDGFNEVDNLIFSSLSYLPLDKIFENGQNQEYTLVQLDDLLHQHYDVEHLFGSHSFVRDTPELLRCAKNTNRYKDVCVRNYVNVSDQQRNLQFSAMEFVLPDDSVFVAYRGTDGQIVGWKEDFLMATMQVEAEKESVAFLNRVGQQDQRNIRVGGHSKGGHLAVFAAVCCDRNVQDRILDVYSNDGPGFFNDFLTDEAFGRMESRIHRIIPEESIVGLIFEHAVSPTIVKSDLKNFMQHNAFSWGIEGNRFMTVSDISKTAKLADHSMKEWMNNLGEAERMEFIHDLFEVLEAPGVKTLPELQEGGISTMQIISKKINKLPADTKEKITELMKEFFHSWTETISEKHNPN